MSAASAATVDVLHTSRGDFAALRWTALPRRDPAPNISALPLIVLLHGFPDHPPNFAPLAMALGELGFDVVAPWLRGYAPSPRTGDLTLEGLTADIVAIIPALSSQPVMLVGHDWGAVLTYTTCAAMPGLVAQAVAMSVPHPLTFVASLVGRQAFRSWYMAAFQLPGAAAASKAKRFALIHWLWRRWSPSYRLAPAKQAALETTLAASWPAPLQYYRSALRPISAARGRLRGPLAGTISVPTLYLHGADDGCITMPARSQAPHMAAPFQQQLIADAGHFLPHEAPKRCAEEISAWHHANT